MLLYFEYALLPCSDAYPTPPRIPLRKANYHKKLLEVPFRTPAKPLHVTQPQVRLLRTSDATFTDNSWVVTIDCRFAALLLLTHVRGNSRQRIMLSTELFEVSDGRPAGIAAASPCPVCPVEPVTPQIICHQAAGAVHG